MITSQLKSICLQFYLTTRLLSTRSIAISHRVCYIGYHYIHYHCFRYYCLWLGAWIVIVVSLHTTTYYQLKPYPLPLLQVLLSLTRCLNSNSSVTTYHYIPSTTTIPLPLQASLSLTGTWVVTLVLPYIANTINHHNQVSLSFFADINHY